MRDAHNKMSKRHGDPSYEDLIAQGYLSDAVVNYVALLGWSPGGEQEIFSLSELAGIFDIKGISKSPAIFDREKLDYFNSTYLKALSPEAFFAAAEPYVRQAVPNPTIDAKLVAPLLQTRLSRLTEIPELVDFFEALPDYDLELYEHKKSKSSRETSLTALRAALPVLEELGEWSNEAVYAAMVSLAEALAVKNSVVLWPLRVAVSGKASTPGGATELCAILGKQESIARIRKGIALLDTACTAN
jgi:glutamyl-tRNA synthetase